MADSSRSEMYFCPEKTNWEILLFELAQFSNRFLLVWDVGNSTIGLYGKVSAG
jgi:hypothetical protein